MVGADLFPPPLGDGARPRHGRRRPGAFVQRARLHELPSGRRSWRLTEGADDDAVSLVMRIDIPPQDEDQRRQLAEHRINNIPDPTCMAATADLRADAWARRRVPAWTALYGIPLSLADGGRVDLRQPTYSVDDLGYGRCTCRSACRRAWRHSSSAWACSRRSTRKTSSPGRIRMTDGDGISGRANRVWNRASGAGDVGPLRPQGRPAEYRRAIAGGVLDRPGPVGPAVSGMPQATARTPAGLPIRRRTATACNTMTWRRIASLPIW